MWSDLDEICERKRAEGWRHKASADIERAEVDREIASLIQEHADFCLCIGVIAGIEQDPLPAGHLWFWQDVRLDMVECLDDSSAWYQLAEHPAGRFTTKIDHLDAVGSKGVARVPRLRRARFKERDGVGGVYHDT